ncbi:RM35-like protein [Mya arenaria]|uniref:Large ribosomal subunit protein bL35m n=1 Tax=Mya arenaria TaxID=6604 RepID=A0ABY7FGG7_MYAAR|nr:RM35-like protein [Mya arenaria]
MNPGDERLKYGKSCSRRKNAPFPTSPNTIQLIGCLARTLKPTAVISACQERCLSSLTRGTTPSISHRPMIVTPINQTAGPYGGSRSLLDVCLPYVTTVRTKVRYSRKQGKEKTVKAVPKRFFRLAWGIYIHARAGRNKRRWAKPEWIIERGKQHVFCNKQQTKLYDKMSTGYWRKHRHYVDDPYTPYQKRTGMPKLYTPPNSNSNDFNVEDNPLYNK